MQKVVHLYEKKLILFGKTERISLMESNFLHSEKENAGSSGSDVKYGFRYLHRCYLAR